MTSFIVAFIVSVIVSTIWLNIIHRRVERLQSDVAFLVCELNKRARPGTIINTADFIRQLRGYEVKASDRP